MPAYNVVRYGQHPSQFIEIWPAGDHPIGTAILVHGGYWRDRYGLDLMHPMAAHLVDQGWTVVNIEYRRLGEPKAEPPAPAGPAVPVGPQTTAQDVWPAMSSDVLAAIDAAGPPRSPFVIIGHSAGGQLALWAGASRSSTVDGVVALAPVADLIEADRLGLSDGVVRRLLGGDSTARRALYLAASPRALLPLGVPQLVVHGSADDAVPQQLAVDYGAAAEAAGDPIEVLLPDGVDHFHIIDPDHWIWRPVDEWLEATADRADR